MADDPNRPRQDCKSAFPEFWNVKFYHRIVRTTIGEKLKTSHEVPQGLPHSMVVLLMQMNEQHGQRYRPGPLPVLPVMTANLPRVKPGGENAGRRP
jgi:hypothetical protein